MKHLGIFALLATMALGAPAEQSGIEARAVAIAKMNLAIRNAPHQGDGLYIASSDENGDYTIDFTPWEELEPVPAEITEYYNNATANAETTLKSRGASVTCSGRDGSKDLLRVANEAAANNAQAHGSYAAGSTGWVYYQTENSFFCNYKSITWNYQWMIDRQIAVTNSCGEPGYGYQHCTNDCGGISDASVGRTFYGDHYC